MKLIRSAGNKVTQGAKHFALGFFTCKGQNHSTCLIYLEQCFSNFYMQKKTSLEQSFLAPIPKDSDSAGWGRGHDYVCLGSSQRRGCQVTLMLTDPKPVENPWFLLWVRIYDMQKQSIELCNLNGSVKSTTKKITFIKVILVKQKWTMTEGMQGTYIQHFPGGLKF